ncbi:stalk domain-containing protein [Paenibacillus sp. NEAU-GSW1]|uniref:stalk domain-containing protein n=1 Tax=Paenibacillus sp. NEAU-GSW1 TaxID=2682486 RepID=UPI001C12CBBB|nr:stalk domain-containing protein [Paenibacillus sp. NEAU-GSW1]
MRKSKVISFVLLLTMLLTTALVAPASAAGLQGTEFHLGEQDSGYTIVVPGYKQSKEVNLAADYEDEDPYYADVLVVDMPKKNSDGTYSLFEIKTTDKAAYMLYAMAMSMNMDNEQSGDFEAQFKNGSVVVQPKITKDEKASELVAGETYGFYFISADKADEEIFSAELYVQFVDKTAKPTASKVVVDGKEIAFEAYQIDGSNYFKLRDLAMVVNGSAKQFQVGWDSASNAINLTKGAAYTPDGKELKVSPNPTNKKALPTSSKILVDGKEVSFTAYNIGGNNYFKLRDIAKVFDFAVTWDSALNTVGIDTSAAYKE